MSRARGLRVNPKPDTGEVDIVVVHDRDLTLRIAEEDARWLAGALLNAIGPMPIAGANVRLLEDDRRDDVDQAAQPGGPE